MKGFEVNFDGLVGPTHNYAGLSYGNVASVEHALTVSNPKAAVLQGIEKMRLLMDLGLKQAVLPPQERPDMRSLRRLGFHGTDTQVISQAAREAPFVLAACYSASSMWAANAATVSPSADTDDGMVHFTPANLLSFFHRSLESRFTARVLKTIFNASTTFAHHDPLPATVQLADEGAANHSRLCTEYGGPGIEFFVYGRQGFNVADQGPSTFPARQTLEASSAIARLHRLLPPKTVYARQNPDVIECGVFHNDVISVGNQNVFLCHGHAFTDMRAVLDALKRTFRELCGNELIVREITPGEVPVEDAVASYLFNSQLVTLPDETMCLIAPIESRENRRAASFIDRLLQESNPISQLKFIDVRQSMKNGGGPACLRLRAVLTEREAALTHQGIYLTDSLYQGLKDWAERHYRDRLDPHDLTDPSLVQESHTALDALTQLLKLGSLYDFQRAGTY